MKHLIKKDWLLTRYVHLAFLVLGLSVIPICLNKPVGGPIIAVFLQIIYMHLLVTLARPGIGGGAENLLLGTLPIKRRSVVNAKYLFYLCCALGFSLYMCLLMWRLRVYGLALPFSPWALFPMIAAIGILYNTLIMPLAFVSPKWSGILSAVVYIAIIILPQKISAWLGYGEGNEGFQAMVMQLIGALKGWTLPVLEASGFLLFDLSLLISQRVYERAEF